MGYTYGLPIQFLGPTIKGSNISRLSALNLGSSFSQRSGMNASGSTKLVGEWKAVFWGMPARYWVYKHEG